VVSVHRPDTRLDGVERRENDLPVNLSRWFDHGQYGIHQRSDNRLRHGFSIERVSDDATTAAKRLTLDSIGCCLGAYSSPLSKHLRRAFGSIDASDGATVFGSGATTRTEYAGLINATMVRYLDYNDTYISEGRACHPSDHIPALISVAEAEDRTGEELIEAIVLAYEIEGMGLDTGVTWEHDYDYVTWGAYSSVAAAGKLMGLSRTQLKQSPRYRGVVERRFEHLAQRRG